MGRKDIEQIGKKYGCYILLEFLPNKPHEKRYCLCRCEICGEIRKVGYYKLTHNLYEYCPKCRPKPQVKNDLVGKKFGRLTVIERVENRVQPNGETKVMYRCLCECGNECIVTYSHLVSGHTTSCGCFHKERVNNTQFNNILGKKFGRLTVIDRLTEKLKGRTMWVCQCECGNKCIASVSSLTSGKKKSCGCLNSSMEEEFEKMLIDKNICYEKQYKFKECKDVRPLPFDFGIFDGEKMVMVVELNGEQHYHPFTFCGEDSEQKIKNFNDRVRKDNIKEEFCKTNNVPLLVISYRKFKKKNEIFEEFIKNNKIFS